MNDSDFATEKLRVNEYSMLRQKLERFERAVENLGVDGARLCVEIGGAQTHFQVFKSEETEFLRSWILQAFRSEVGTIKDEMRSI